jgi:hypothetical protein
MIMMMIMSLIMLSASLYQVSTDEFTTQSRTAWTVVRDGVTYNVVGSVRQGLWKTCVSNIVVDGVAYSDPTSGPMCARISSDGDCSVTINHPTANTVLNTELDECHDFQSNTPPFLLPLSLLDHSFAVGWFSSIC